MDQDQASEALNSSATTTGKKLNARAPEFVPRASAAPPPPPPLLRPVYARPPSFVPPPYYGYDNYYQQDATPFYGYNVNPVARGDHSADANTGSSAASAKSGLSDAHQKVVNQVRFHPCLTVIGFE